MTTSDKYEGKHCEICGTGTDITRDHIIPKWLERRFAYFQLDVYIVNNDQYLCKSHNSQKGGKIDYKDIRVRNFIKKFIGMLEEKLRDVEETIRIEKFKSTMEEKRLKDTEIKVVKVVKKKEKPVIELSNEENEIIESKERVRNKRENKAKEKKDLDEIKF